MSYKRRALGALSRVELLEAGEVLGVALGRDMSLEQMQDVTAASDGARLEDILPRLPRHTLKAVCDAVGLDRTGRDKNALVDRIVGGAPAAERGSAVPPRGRGRAAA